MNMMMMMLMMFTIYSTAASGVDQIPETNNLTPNFSRLRIGLETNQLAVNKRCREFELVTTLNKSSLLSERDLNSGAPNCKSSAL